MIEDEDRNIETISEEVSNLFTGMSWGTVGNRFNERRLSVSRGKDKESELEVRPRRTNKSSRYLSLNKNVPVVENKKKKNLTIVYELYNSFIKLFICSL